MTTLPQTQQTRDRDHIIGLMTNIVKSLVDREDEVVIRPVNGEENTVLEVRVAEGDVGHLLGTGGRNAEAIRLLLKAMCKKHNVKISFDVLTNRGAHARFWQE